MLIQFLMAEWLWVAESWLVPGVIVSGDFIVAATSVITGDRLLDTLGCDSTELLMPSPQSPQSSHVSLQA